MRLFMLRDRATGEWINKNRRTSNRIYEHKRHAASAASMIAQRQWPRTGNRGWWYLEPDERRTFRDSIIEIVELEAHEVGA